MKRLVAALIFICCGTFLSCSKTDPVNTGYDLSAIDLSVGSVNKYLYVVFEEDSGTVRETYRDTFAVRVEAIGQTIGEYTGLTKIRAYDAGNEMPYTYAWYKQTSAELIDVAYQSAGGVPVIMPKRGSQRNMYSSYKNSAPFGLQILSGRFNTFQDTIVRTDLRTVYKYPLSAGTSWTSFSDPFVQTREVKGKETVTLPVGAFTCTKILSKLPDIAPSLEWYDYVSDEGLIMRTISDSVMATTVDNPDGIGIKIKTTFQLQLIQRTQ